MFLFGYTNANIWLLLSGHKVSLKYFMAKKVLVKFGTRGILKWFMLHYYYYYYLLLLLLQWWLTHWISSLNGISLKSQRAAYVSENPPGEDTFKHTQSICKYMSFLERQMYQWSSGYFFSRNLKNCSKVGKNKYFNCNDLFKFKNWQSLSASDWSSLPCGPVEGILKIHYPLDVWIGYTVYGLRSN